MMQKKRRIGSWIMCGLLMAELAVGSIWIACHYGPEITHYDAVETIESEVTTLVHNRFESIKNAVRR